VVRRAAAARLRAAGPRLARAIKPWHARAAWLLGLLVLLHVAAVIQHHWLLRDGLLKRMAPWVR
jgi:cytochrome b561